MQTEHVVQPSCVCACRTFMSAMFLAVMFGAFGGMPQLAVTLQNRSVWFKHRAMNLHTATSYAWASALVQMPLSILESLLFLIAFYFMCVSAVDSVVLIRTFAGGSNQISSDCLWRIEVPCCNDIGYALRCTSVARKCAPRLCIRLQDWPFA